mmetsp:Transcript_57951/g.164989  ORF Transcript_57951/g.164989 Transcript_57951/m.164989 type:complete len:255 (+) Transcript_57951:805-1569(+)
MEGMRVEPPTRTISLMSEAETFASLMAFSTGALQRLIRVPAICSNFALDSVSSMCFGPVASAVMNGRDTLASCTPDSSTFAFSAASVKRCKACLSCNKSMPSAFLKPSANQSTMTLSKSSPPRWVSPLVESTSQTPSPTSSTETSKVPPPRSNTMMVSLDFFSRPYASEAAVGSFTMRNTSSPAILPASLVAWRCESLKYAGTVTTALLTVALRYLPASAASLRRTCAEISSGANCLPAIGQSILSLEPTVSTV